MGLPPAGLEALDASDLDDSVAESTLRDIARTNALFGGHAALQYGVKQLARRLPATAPLTLLDVGAGSGAGMRRMRRVLGDRTYLTALDHHRTAARMCQMQGITSIVGDMWHLPMQANSFDIVVVNQVLHHVPRADVVRMVAYLNAMARLGVVIADLRRSPLAVAGFRVASGILRLHQVTRHDGQVSLRRGFTHSELKHIIDEAGIKDGLVHRRPGWRLVAYWRTCNENG